MALWLVAAAIHGLVGVAMGAYAAHGMAGTIEPQRQAWMETAVSYQMWHALALLAVAALAANHGMRERSPGGAALALAGVGFFLGALLFSGSLYLLALAGSRGLVWVTPFGGVAFLVGWVALGWYGIAQWRNGANPVR
ncbi:DUF423 domain-containing protein [Virgifigura deserti]|uniref:DUF423 domain-containing protein n=1 Tax=Virgifigura deserti TaxID=2268457 RepID=UPI003CCB95F9